SASTMRPSLRPVGYSASSPGGVGERGFSVGEVRAPADFSSRGGDVDWNAAFSLFCVDEYLKSGRSVVAKVWVLTLAEPGRAGSWRFDIVESRGGSSRWKRDTRSRWEK